MGKRKIVIKQSVAYSIAKVSWFIESKGLITTAERYTDLIYQFIDGIADERKSFPYCRDPKRALLNFKCISFKKKYTIVFIETDTEILITEFISSKLIHWT